MIKWRAPVVWPALGALVGAAPAGVTRGEVERIWLPYAAWVIAVTAAYRAPARTMLAAHAVTALLIQALVRSPW